MSHRESETYESIWGCYLRAFVPAPRRPRGTRRAAHVYALMEGCMSKKADLYRAMFGRHWNALQEKNERIVRLNNWQ